MDAPQFPRDLLDDEFHLALARHARAHEAELFRRARFGEAAVARIGLANRADTVHADHHLVARAQIADEPTFGSRAVPHDDAVHALVFHAPPTAAATNLRRVDRGDGEIGGRYPWLDDEFEPRVFFVGRRLSRPERDELCHDPVQRFRRGRGNLQPRARRTLALPPEVELQDLEAARSLHHGVQRAVQQSGIQQMTFQRDLPALDGGAGVGVLAYLLVQTQRQAFRRATGLHELRQRRLHHFKTGRRQTVAQLGAGFVDDQRLPDVHRVADEVDGIGLCHGEAPGGGHAQFDEPVRVRIERVGIVKQISACQRAEARVEMVEAFVDQTQ